MQDDSEDNLASQTTLTHILDAPEKQHGTRKWKEEEIPKLESIMFSFPWAKFSRPFLRTPQGAAVTVVSRISRLGLAIISYSYSQRNKTTHVNKSLWIFLVVRFHPNNMAFRKTPVLFFSHLKMAGTSFDTCVLPHNSTRLFSDFVWGKGTQPRIDGETEGANGSVFCKIICANKCVIISYNVNNSYHYCSSNIICTTNF